MIKYQNVKYYFYREKRIIRIIMRQWAIYWFFLSLKEATINHFLLFWACTCATADFCSLLCQFEPFLGTKVTSSDGGKLTEWGAELNLAYFFFFFFGIGVETHNLLTCILYFFCHFQCERVVAISKMYLRQKLTYASFLCSFPIKNNPHILGWEYSNTFHGCWL